jgi:chromosome segregation ATPase
MGIVMSDEWLERIERKIDAQTRSQQRWLDAIDNKLETHGRQLDAHGTEQHRLGVLVEKLQDDMRGVAEGLIGLDERMDRGFRDVLVRLDERIAPLEAAFRSVATTLADHERRLPKRPRRRRHD